MITHEEAISIMQVLESDDAYYDARIEEHKKMYKYINQQETLQAEHEALKKDVARYIELTNIYLSNQLKFQKKEEYQEYFRLKLNLESR